MVETKNYLSFLEEEVKKDNVSMDEDFFTSKLKRSSSDSEIIKESKQNLVVRKSTDIKPVPVEEIQQWLEVPFPVEMFQNQCLEVHFTVDRFESLCDPKKKAREKKPKKGTNYKRINI